MSEERFIKLLVRPQVQPSEGVAEYLQRLAKANGFPSLVPLHNLIGIPLNDIVVSGHEILRKVIEGKSPTISLKNVSATKSGINPYQEQRGVFLNARVCASCLRESDLLESEWSEPLSIVCSKHNEVLLDRCPRCSRIMRRTASQYQCICGQEFKNVISKPSPPWIKRFYRLFCPWRIDPQEDVARTEFLRSEILAARLVRQLLNRTGLEVPSKARNWIFTSDHEAVARLCSTDDLLRTLIATNVELYVQFGRRWRQQEAISGFEDRPAVFLLLESVRAQTVAENRKSALEHQKLRLENASTTANVARRLGITHLTATRAMRDPVWQNTLRRSTNALPNDTILDCVIRWVSDTLSDDDVRKATGLSGTWWAAFKSLYMSRLCPSQRNKGRFLKDTVDRFFKGLSQCLLLGEGKFSSTDEVICLIKLKDTKGSLPKQILLLVANGTLPIIRIRKDSDTTLRILECAAPLSAILTLPDRQHKWRLKALAQRPGGRSCLS